ncbi:MAG: hypothetical protein ACC651_15730 [Candidatus Scalindua sp.]
MSKEQKKNILGQTVSLKAHLISRIAVLFFVVTALYYTLDEHWLKIETSILSLLMVILLILAVAISFGITAHAFWKYVKHGENT